MIVAVTLALLVWAVWRGAPWVALACMAAGLAIHMALLVRLVRASVGGVGGHAEWVRDSSVRPRLQRDPGWLVGTALVLAGLVVALVR
ncbi:MAG TPA: hypothetical protein VMS22_11680 [Candidatus Eisenbacteria bacterium]|nr:hypothetical protein [Candidatus Eisenbacteria bacterium]